MIDQFDVIRQDVFPFMWVIVRKNKRLIPTALHGVFSTKEDGLHFLSVALRNKEQKNANVTSTSGD